ncbi:hypothetical protein LTR85_009899 [Meristemomyces frigidus]|nr:hypothetical protein LTR85_009899 [Meristemomyces frigidus]
MGAIDPALAADGADPNSPQQIPPISQAVPQGPAMQTLQPQHPDQYRALPAPPQMYAPPYQPQQMGYPPTQPAPRQRTAIACRYCRRRKIRCSGFDQSEDGRCTNCQRFSQECVFTPVSAQTQAFVPAHTVWRGQNPPPNTQLYGAYGQPLPPQGNQNQYPPQQGPQPGQQQGQQQQQQQQQQPGQYPPPPQGYQQQAMYQQPPPNMQPIQGQQVQAGQKRSLDEPHTPTQPPPNPAEQAQGQRGSFGYPDPTGLHPAGASPASSTASFHSAQPPVHPYHAVQPPAHRASPQSAYSFDASRASSSPHMLGQSGTPAPPTSGTLQPAMPIREGRTPPPGMTAANAARHGVKINDIVGHASQQQQQQQAAALAAMKQEERERTSTDTNNKETDGTATTEGAEKQEEVKKRNGEVKDAGVQTDDLQALVREQAS